MTVEYWFTVGMCLGALAVLASFTVLDWIYKRPRPSPTTAADLRAQRDVVRGEILRRTR